jgi:hypothetical protein
MRATALAMVPGTTPRASGSRKTWPICTVIRTTSASRPRLLKKAK